MFKPPPQSIILVHLELFFMNELILQEWMQEFGWTDSWCFKTSDAMPSNYFLWGRKLHNVIKISHQDGRYRQFPSGQQHWHCYTAPPMAWALPGRALNSPDVLLGPEWWRNSAGVWTGWTPACCSEQTKVLADVRNLFIFSTSLLNKCIWNSSDRVQRATWVELQKYPSSSIKKNFQLHYVFVNLPQEWDKARSEAFSKYRENIWICGEELWVGGTCLGPTLMTKCYLMLKEEGFGGLTNHKRMKGGWKCDAGWHLTF